MTYYFDMDGVLADFHSTYTERAQALSRDYLANLAPFVENVKTVRNLIAAGSLVYILTKAANEDARQGKLDWLAKYIPEMTAERFICIVMNSSYYGKFTDTQALYDMVCNAQ